MVVTLYVGVNGVSTGGGGGGGSIGPSPPSSNGSFAGGNEKSSSSSMSIGGLSIQSSTVGSGVRSQGHSNTGTDRSVTTGGLGIGVFRGAGVSILGFFGEFVFAS